MARIGAVHGVRGEVKLWSFTADPAAVVAYGPLETEDGRRCEIEALRRSKGFFVAKLRGVADRSAAEKLRNAELFLPRERLPELEGPNEYYHADLIGLRAVDRRGDLLGTVIAVHNFGAGDLLELQPTAGGETILLPFTTAVVPELDIAAGRMVVESSGGMLEAEIAPPRRKGVGGNQCDPQ